MIFEPTEDFGLVERILTRPECYRRMRSDEAPLRSQFRVRAGNYAPVLCLSDGKLVGLFLLVPTRHWDTAEVHFCFVPEFWGRAEEAGLQFLKWIWRETELQTLLGPVPSYNRLALRLAKACGFQQVLIERGKVKRGGRAYDLLIMAVKRP